MNSITIIIFSLVFGGLAYRSVGRTHEWLKPEQLINRPQLLHRIALAPLLVSIGYWITLASSALLGWCYYGWIGIIINYVGVILSSLMLDVCIELLLPLKLRYRWPLNPIVHLFVLPYVYLVGAIFVFINHKP